MDADKWRLLDKIGLRCGIPGKDLLKLNAGALRVLTLLSDGKWHSTAEVHLAAGREGVPAKDGVRRLREIRACGITTEGRYKRGHDGTKRDYEYRIWFPTRD